MVPKRGRKQFAMAPTFGRQSVVFAIPVGTCAAPAFSSHGRKCPFFVSFWRAAGQDYPDIFSMLGDFFVPDDAMLCSQIS